MYTVNTELLIDAPGVVYVGRHGALDTFDFVGYRAPSRPAGGRRYRVLGHDAGNPAAISRIFDITFDAREPRRLGWLWSEAIGLVRLRGAEVRRFIGSPATSSPRSNTG